MIDILPRLLSYDRGAAAIVGAPRARIVLPRPGGHGWLPFRQALLRRWSRAQRAPRRCGPVSSRRRTYRWSERWARAGAAGDLRVIENPRPRDWRAAFDHRSARGAGKRSLGSSLRRRLLSAAALLAPYEPASTTDLLSLPNHMGQPIFAAASTRARTAGRRDAATSRRTAGASHAQETRAGPDSTEGAGSAGKLAFP